MAQSFTLALLLLACHTCSLVFAAYPQQFLHNQIAFQDKDITIRPAVESDLDDITTVIIDAFSPGPLYQYVFPQLDHFKKQLWKCSRKELGRDFADLTDGQFLNVISVPVREADGYVLGERRERVVAIAIWVIMEPSEENTESPRITSLLGSLRRSSCEEHVGLNFTRAIDFSRQFSLAEKQYIDDYPGKQFYLNVLATHPKWDGLGFGAAHCQWGMAMANEMDVPTTLIATPAGWPLYDSLGFDSVANITIKTIDSSDDLWYEYMRYSQ